MPPSLPRCGRETEASAAGRVVESVREPLKLNRDATASPMRVGCDPLGTGMIEAWRGTSDERLMQAMLPAWTGDGSGS